MGVMGQSIAAVDITNENKCDFCSAKCCQYITQEIDAPRSIHAFDVLLWQISHNGVHVFKDDNGWYLLSMTRCDHLQPDNRCGIYEVRPLICREHTTDGCEYDVGIDEGCELYFQTHKELDDYCRERFKKWDKRFEKFAKEQAKEAEKAKKKAEKKAKQKAAKKAKKAKEKASLSSEEKALKKAKKQAKKAAAKQKKNEKTSTAQPIVVEPA